jgi:hypothetical protein
MTATTITALCSGIAGVIVAVTALVKVFTHTHEPPAGDGKP